MTVDELKTAWNALGYSRQWEELSASEIIAFEQQMERKQWWGRIEEVMT